MNFEAIRTLVANKAARPLLVGQKHSPKILFVAGAVGVVATVVVACKATLKTQIVLDNHDEAVAKLRAQHDASVTSDEVFKHDLNRQKLKTFFQITRLYAPTVGLGVLSVGALTSSHVILTRRNTATFAALASVQKGYEEYRSRVREELGEDKDFQFAHGGQMVSVKEKLADGTTATRDEVRIGSKLGLSPYAMVFDEGSKYFSKLPGENQRFLTQRQQWATDKLRARGHLFLNELREMLGFDPIPEGQIVGWLYNHSDEKDGYVSLGIYKGDPEWVQAYENGQEKYVVLDPNVDGNIWEKI